MAVESKKPNPVDVHVGARVRFRRTMMGTSQEKLGEALGVTFQQVQKYEKGTNRVGASRLQKIAEVLQVPVSFFFEGYQGEESQPTGMAEADATFVNDYPVSSESIQLNRAFGKIQDPKVRRRILELVRSLAEAEAEESGSK
ncbi:helix-turn-helix domain-containing protein [Aureimonas flava]|uniref:Helix-turn-helix domain-containing protein n=1 Tax=Aureimonas flava TaxID=2320271 RepID=A0A3A1WRK4_9HYPH|nr:helix-turn-helix domain-containing protein [Aureimonas flava]RIY00788.1 helix-turn-helix domain-containing protein [Aureimonas flava]